MGSAVGKLKRGLRICEWNSSADTKASGEGAGGVPAPGIPCRGAAHVCSPWRSRVRAGGCLQEAETLWEAQPVADLLSGPVTPWDTRAGAVDCWRTAPNGRDSYWINLWKNAIHGKDSCWGGPWRTLSHGRDPRLNQECEESSPWAGKSSRKNLWLMN